MKPVPVFSSPVIVALLYFAAFASGRKRGLRLICLNDFFDKGGPISFGEKLPAVPVRRGENISPKPFAIPPEAGEYAWRMESTTTSEPNIEATAAAPTQKVITAPDYSSEAQPISQFTARSDYPGCLHGVHIDIRGFTGVVVEIVNQSIRVLSPDGILQSFNFNRLKTLHAPPSRSEPTPSTREVESPKPGTSPESGVAEEAPDVEEPERVYIADPDFSVPFKKIDDYAGQPDFPQCAYGMHVDIRDYTGVVVEIVKGSLKIQSSDGIISSYNAAVLKRLYGKS